jgi:hypothetical protein
VPVLNSGQVRLKWSEGSASKLAIFEVVNFNTADTIDFGVPELASNFSAIKFAYIADLTSLKAGTCTVVGLVVTLAPATMVADGGYLVVYGATA